MIDQPSHLEANPAQERPTVAVAVAVAPPLPLFDCGPRVSSVGQVQLQVSCRCDTQPHQFSNDHDDNQLARSSIPKT